MSLEFIHKSEYVVLFPEKLEDLSASLLLANNKLFT